MNIFLCGPLCASATGSCARIFRKFLATTLLLAAAPAFAAGTLAGTDINNEANVAYQVGATALTQTSNTVTVTVAELVDLTIILQSPQMPSAPGATNQELLFSLTNTGNGDEVFSLLINNALAGDDFDPIQSATSLFFDTDGSGDLSAGDTPYSPGNNDPALAPDGSIALLVVNDMPAGLANAALGQSALAATSLTGTGAPGTVFAGAGDGGVDAIIGTSSGSAQATGEYVISTVDVAVVKSASVTDPFGGAEPVPGAEILWRIEVTASGSGTAAAANVNDLMPNNTTYVSGSLQLNGGSLSDAPDADAGQYLNATNAIDVVLGDLTQASGTQVVEFSVTIN